VDLEDFKSFCRVLKPSGVGSIPTHSRQYWISGVGRTLGTEIVYVMNRIRYRTGGIVSIILLAAAVGSIGVSATPAGGRSDETVPVDSVTVDEVQPLWTVEDLDSVLTAESGADIPEGFSWKRRKNSRVAMLCALLFPGLGQIYNEKPYKAALVMGVETFYLSNILLNYRYAEREDYLRSRSVPGSEEWDEHDVMTGYYKERMIDWVWWTAGAMLIIVLDAYVDAHLHDMNFEVEGRAIGDGAGISLGFAF
jgi:hypothetical protein